MKNTETIAASCHTGIISMCVLTFTFTFLFGGNLVSWKKDETIETTNI